MDRESSQESPDHEPTNEVLVKINESYEQSKADQIFRLIGDQDSLNRRFQQCSLANADDLSSHSSESDSSSDNGSVEEVEKKIALRLSLQKHEGYRSKTSIGFYDYPHDEANTTPPEMEESVTASNTRQNRPKSSYMRRRQYVQTPDSNYEVRMNSDYENPSNHGSRRLRPRSRAGRSADQRQRKIGFQETDIDTYNPTESPPTTANLGATQFHDSRQRKLVRKEQDSNRVQLTTSNMKTHVQETNIDLDLDLGDLGDDDRPRHKKIVPRETDLDLYMAQHKPQTDGDSYQNIPRHRKIMRQETDNHHVNSRPPPKGDSSHVRHGITKPGNQGHFHGTVAPRASPNFENRRKDRSSHHRTTTPALLIRRQKTNVRKFTGAADNTANTNLNTEDIKQPPEIKKGTKDKDDKRTANSNFYRSKTSLHPTDSRRPNSESVFIVRQRAEKKLITANAPVRPKSDKTLLNSGKTVLSINDSPYQSAQSSTAKIQQPVLSSPTTVQHPNQKDYKEFNGTHVRVMSAKRKIPPQELQLPRQPNVIRDRSQNMALMKLPPLDATMSKRADRVVVPRETCV